MVFHAERNGQVACPAGSAQTRAVTPHGVQIRLLPAVQSVCTPRAMETVRLAALPTSAVGRPLGVAVGSRILESIRLSPLNAASAPARAPRQHRPLAALPPPPWPHCSRRYSASSTAPAHSSDLSCRASQGAEGGSPDPQQQVFQQQQQQQQQQQVGSSTSTAAGGLRGTLQRSDSWVLRACRSVMAYHEAACIVQ